MSSASRAVNRLGKLYRHVLLQARASAAGPWGSRPPNPAERFLAEVEPLEMRLLLADWSGAIPDGTVWSAGEVQCVTANAEVPAGCTLTIEPGAIVKFHPWVGLVVEGVLAAQGSAGSPIYFTSWWDDTLGGDTDGQGGARQPAAGDWTRIEFRNGAAASVLDHVEARYGGYWSDTPLGMFYVHGGQLTLTNSLLRASAGSAIRIEGADPTLTDDAVQDTQYGAAISMDLASSPTITNATFTNNLINGAMLDEGTLSGNATWNNPGVVYYLAGHQVTVPEGTTLTIGPGQIIKSDHWDTALVVDGTLDAQGTAESPIIYTSRYDDTAGGDTNNDGGAMAPSANAGRIRIGSTSTGSVMDHVEIRYSKGLVVDGGELAMTDSRVWKNWDGVRMVGASPTISDCIIEECTYAALSGDLDADPVLSGLTITNNGLNGLLLDGGTITGNRTWNHPDLVYVITEDVDIAVGATLTVAPGQIVKFQTEDTFYGLTVFGTLHADGTAAQPIIFTTERDDSAGGDTDNDGGANAPGDNIWGGIRFANNPVGTSQVINHIEVRYSDGVRIYSYAPIAIQNSVIRDSKYDGVDVPSGGFGLVEFTNCLIVRSGDVGLYSYGSSVGSKISLTNCVIDGNQGGGIQVKQQSLPTTASNITLTNSLVTNNLNFGVQIEDGAVANLAYNDVYNPGAADYDIIPTQTGLNHNISQDPLYASPSNLNYRVQAGSPVIDSGTSDNAPATDLQDVLRTDDLSTPNTGGGAFPYYDRGAYEFGGLPPSEMDLAVGNVSGPAAGVQDGTISITWTITNIGPDAADGSWYEAIYLSRDTAWSRDDLLIGSRVHTGGLEADGGYYDAQADVPIHSIAPGTYYYLVRTDARYETAEAPDVRANNVAASTETVTFLMPELVLGTPWADSFDQAGRSKCYRLTVPVGGVLRVSLDDADNQGINELYVRFGSPPVPGSGGAYAYSSVGKADHAILIPSAPAGDWYILAANASGIGEYTLTADVSTVRLSQVTPESLGNAAPMTLTLRGAGFQGASAVSLVAAGGASYAAPDVSVDSFTLITATFAAGAVPPGTYTVRVTAPGGESSELPDALQVLAGGSVSFKTGIVVPAQVGYHQLAVIYAECTNTGQLAALAPLLVISAEQTGQRRAFLTLDPSILPAGLWSSAMPEGFSSTVCALATGAVPGTIQPGETVRVPVYYAGWRTPWNFSYPPIQFGVGIIPADSTAPVDWTALKSEMQPPDVTGAAWDAIWSTFTARAGSTWGGLISCLDDDASYLGRLGQNVRDFYALAGSEIRQADGNHALKQLAGRTDASCPAPGMPLVFSRAYPTGVSQRYKLGPLGRGWACFTQVRISQAADGEVSVILNGVPVRQFQPDTRGGYFSQGGDYGVLSSLGAGRFQIREGDGSVSVFRADGLLDYSEDANQNRITNGYDALGRLTGMTHSSGQVMQIAYNAGGRIATVTDAAGRQTLFTYDASYEHLLSVQDPDGTTEQYTYNAATTGPLAHALTSIRYADGTRRTFSYDAAGRLIGESRDGGAEAVTYAYDSAGRLDVTDAAGATSHLYFDHRGLMLKTVDPLDHTVQMIYDGKGLLTRMIDSAGLSRTYQYDSRGNMIGLSDPAGHSASFTYDATLNRLTSLTDFAGNLTQYEYDAKGNLIARTYPDGQVARATYDPKGLLQQATDRRGNAIAYTYDAAGRLTSATYGDATHADYAYDARGNLTSATDRQGQTTTFTYDANDRLTRVTDPSGRYVEYTYDLVGRRTRMVDQDGLGVNYQYDALGRLARLTDEAGATLVTYTYDAVGRLARADHGNGTYTTYQYDLGGQLTCLTNFAPGGAINSRFEYTYDALGRRTGAITPEGTWAYAYDAIGQLISETRPDGTVVQYAYDANGNRQSVTVDGVVTDYVVNNMNQYVSVGGATYSYDADGNLTGIADGAAVTTYTYDENGQLTAATTPAGTWSYEYNALGQRVACVHEGQRWASQLDALNPLAVVAEYDGAGTRLARYATGLGLVARTDASGTAYYDFDALGSTVGISDAAGAYVNTYSYSPFGEQLTATGALPNPFCYVGQWGVTTDSTNFQFMQARYYLSDIGRFATPDPIGLAGGDLNLYRYVGNTPTMLVDPIGLKRPVDAKTFWRMYENAVTGLALALFVQVMRMDAAEEAGDDDAYDEAREWAADLLYAAEALIFAMNTIFEVDDPTGILGGINKLEKPPGLRGRAGKGSKDRTPASGRGPVGALQASTSMGMGCPNIGALGPEAEEVAENQWGTSQPVASSDPNAKTGPAGYGPAGCVGADQLMSYRVDFENESGAPAPAQVVQVSDDLDGDLDWTTFQVTEAGFGDHVIPVAGPTSHFTWTEPMTYGGHNLQVSVDIGIDPDSGEVLATYSTIDADTGLPPDVSIGFLPPEDGTGRGMGWFSYTIQTLPALADGTEIRNVADITFDFGLTIATNQVDPHDPAQGTDPDKECLNTIDAAAPESQVQPLPAVTQTTAFLVQWTGQDGPAGAGVGRYSVYVSEDGGPWTLWKDDTPDAQGTFAGENGRTYAFYSVATDYVGNAEAGPAAADASTTIDALREHVLDPAARTGRWTYPDADGDWVTVTLRGKGVTARVLREALDEAARADATAIIIEGSNPNATLTITVRKAGDGDGKTSVGGIEADGWLYSITGGAVSLTGDLTVAGLLRSLKLDDVAPGCAIDIAEDVLLPEDIGRWKLSIRLDRLADVRVATHLLPIGYLSLNEWLAADGQSGADEVVDSVSAPYLDQLYVRGRSKDAGATDGDFQAGLELHGANAQGYALGSAYIAGEVACTWDISGGDARLIRAGSTAASWELDAGDHYVRTVRTTGGLCGSLGAGRFGTIWAGADLTADVTATGCHPRYLTSVGTLYARSVKDTTLDLAGGLSTARIREWIDGDGDGEAGSLAAGWIGGLYTQGSTRDHVDGDFAADVTVTGLNVPARKKALGTASFAGDLLGCIDVTGDLNRLWVGGGVRGEEGDCLTVRTTGNMNSVSLASSEHADFLAGVEENGQRHPETADDFVDDVLAAIKTFTVRGVRGSHEYFFQDTTLSAGCFGTVSLRNADPATGECGLYYRDLPGGLSKIQHLDTPTGERWTLPERSSDDLAAPAGFLTPL